MLHHLISIWFGWVEQWGYLGIILLMAMESSIFPVPSEVVIPPAAFWAAQGKFNIWGVIAAGTFGSWLGSAITYGVALWLGRIVVLKWGGLFMITEEKLERAERFVHRYETGGIFFARLLPVIRHLISIPAGMVRMKFATFSLMTVLGSFIWCSVLAWYGHRLALQSPDLINDPTKLIETIKHQSLPLIAFIAMICVLYIIAMKLTAKPVKPAA